MIYDHMEPNPDKPPLYFWLIMAASLILAVVFLWEIFVRFWVGI